MPVSRQTAEALSQALVDLFAQGQETMLKRIAKSLAKDMDEPEWAARKLAQMKAYEREMRTLTAQLLNASDKQIESLLQEAYGRGAAAAAADIGVVTGLGTTGPLAQTPALTALVEETIGSIRATGPRILRSALDVYRAAVAPAVGQVVLGTETRRQAAQQVLDDFAGRGVTGFVDKAGRAWSLESYAEMAVRAGTMKASTQGHMDTLQEHGMDLVIVSADGSPCELCQPWEGQVLSISGDHPDYPSVEECEAAGWGHPNCVVAGARISGPTAVAAFTRWYEGEIVVVLTAVGNNITVTPNHPILTRNGWVAAGALDEGDEVVCYCGGKRVTASLDPNVDDMPPLIEEIAGTLIKAGAVSTPRVPVAPLDFHGDGIGGEVDVVFPDGLLLSDRNTTLNHPASKQEFSLGDMRQSAFFAERSFSEVGICALHASDRSMGSGRKTAPLLGRHPSEPSPHCLAARQAGIAVGGHAGGERCLADTDGFSGLLLGEFPGEVALDRVVKVEFRDFAGHVYNLQTVDGWFACNTIVTHNCRHTLSAYQEGVTRDYPEKSEQDLADEAERYADNQKLRYLERQTRAAKREQAVALDPAAKAKATAKVKAYQGKIRNHVGTTDAVRQYPREQINKAH